MGLFKKKDKGMNNVPPLPDQLPPIEQGQFPPVGGMPPIQEANTHDQIPNDIQLNPLVATPPPMNFSPDNLPNIDVPESNIPNPDNFSDNVPGDVQTMQPNELPSLPEINNEQLDLPELPELPDGQPNPEISEAPYALEESVPAPEVSQQMPEPIPEEDEVPEPPAIFSDSSFYETPNEIKHLVKERKEEQAHYYVPEEQEAYEAPGTEAIGEKPETKVYQRTGPIFIDIDSFRTMLGDIDTIKGDIKSSEIILEHLQEIKNSKDKELERWRLQLEDIQRKVNYVDKALFNEA